MTTFDDRKKAHEEKYARDADTRFRIDARRRKLMGLWVAEQMRMEENETLDYAAEFVKIGVKDTNDGAIASNALKDMQEKGIDITEREIREKLAEFHEKACKQVIGS